MKFVINDGLTIRYEWINNHKNRTFVFINSLGTDFRIWDEVVEVLKIEGNILLFDKRGHGLSDVSSNTIGLQDFADDLLKLMVSLSISRCIPVGLSVGGMIALIFAHRNPEMVEKLVLCDTCYKIGSIIKWNERIAVVKENGFRDISNEVVPNWFSEKFRNEQPAQVAGYRNLLERTSVPGYIQTCEAIRDADLTEIAMQIKIPTLCVVGSEDKSTTPEEVKSLGKLIGGSDYRMIQGSGHLPCIDNPKVLSALINEFTCK